MCKLCFFLTMLLLLVLGSASNYVEAASVITIVPAGPATYSITATDLQDAAGMDLVVSYDSTSLESPKVKSGTLTSSAMMQDNVATPGIVRIVFITGGTIRGSGELASVVFTSNGKALLRQPSVSSSVFSTSGTQLAVQSSSSPSQSIAENKIEDTTKNNIVTGSNASSGVTSASSTVAASTTAGLNTHQTTTSLGSVVMPQEAVSNNDVIRQDTRKDEFHNVPAYQNEPTGVSGGAAAPRDDGAGAATKTESKVTITPPTIRSYQSVLDRFRTYKDIRSIKRFSTMFDESSLRAAGFVQTPAIALSSGKSLVTIAIILPNEIDQPSFSLKGANQKSIRHISEKKWEIDAVSQKDKTDVRLSIILKGERTEIPLVVVPPLNGTGTALVALSEGALDSLIAKPLKNNKPAYDLNSDGKQDFIDDYILAAHWVLKQQRSGNKAGQKPVAVGK